MGKRTNSMVLVSLGTLCLLILFAWEAQAADWYACKVVTIGSVTNSSSVQLKIESTGQDLGWYSFPANRERIWLAIALSAMNSGKKVLCKLQWGVPGSLEGIYLVEN